MHETYISKVKMIPDAANGIINMEASVDGPIKGMKLVAQAAFHGEE